LALWDACAPPCLLRTPEAKLLKYNLFFSIFKSQQVAGVILIKVWRSVGKGSRC
jgi:hypothetical protein